MLTSRRFALALVACLSLVNVARAQEVEFARERLFTWKLGVKLSVCAWAHYKGAPAEDVQAELDDCRKLATEGLGVEIPPFPENTDPDKPDEVMGMEYISDTGGKPIGEALQERFGDSMASLFELAMKARLAVILYRPTPGDDMNAAMVEALTRAGTDAGLPESLWKDVPDKIAALATGEEVAAAVEALDENVTKALLADIGDVPGAQP